MSESKPAGDERSLLRRIGRSIFLEPLKPRNEAQRERFLLRNLALHFRSTVVEASTVRLPLSWGLGGMAVVLVVLQLVSGVLLHLPPFFAIFMVPLVSGVALIAIPYVRYKNPAGGVWFVSPVGRRVTLIALAMAIVMTTAALLLNEGFWMLPKGARSAWKKRGSPRKRRRSSGDTFCKRSG